jgi:hypothetical protein
MGISVYNYFIPSGLFNGMEWSGKNGGIFLNPSYPVYARADDFHPSGNKIVVSQSRRDGRILALRNVICTNPEGMT